MTVIGGRCFAVLKKQGMGRLIDKIEDSSEFSII
jgi:hypothetical protein